MTKQELMENYTLEQLADMVIKYQNASEVKSDEINKLKWTISNLEESNGRLKAKVDTYVNYILPRATKEAKELLDKNNFHGIRIVPLDEIEKKCDCGKKDEIDCLRKELQRKENIINQIDDILDKLFGVTHDIAKPDEFEKILRDKVNGNDGSKGYSEKQEKTNNFYGIFSNASKNLKKDDLIIFLGVLTKELLKNGINFRYDMENLKVYNVEIKSDKQIADLLPEEPIKVATVLIENYKQGIYPIYEKDENGEIVYMNDKNRELPIWTGEYESHNELRQIAEHLLVYCNANKEEE